MTCDICGKGDQVIAPDFDAEMLAYNKGWRQPTLTRFNGDPLVSDVCSQECADKAAAELVADLYPR